MHCPSRPALMPPGPRRSPSLARQARQRAVGLARISVLGPTNGSTLVQATGGPVYAEQLNLVAGGTATFQAPFTDINFSNLLAGVNPLNVAFETSGASSKGLYLNGSTIVTGGADLRFGAVQNLNSVALGNTTVAAPWLVATSDHAGYTGSSITAALWLEGSTLDAGAGRIHGGGAATATAVDFMAGVTIDTSVLTAREIALARAQRVRERHQCLPVLAVDIARAVARRTHLDRRLPEHERARGQSASPQRPHRLGRVGHDAQCDPHGTRRCTGARWRWTSAPSTKPRSRSTVVSCTSTAASRTRAMSPAPPE